jgi:hypothetical protein
MRATGIRFGVLDPRSAKALLGIHAQQFHVSTSIGQLTTQNRKLDAQLIELAKQEQQLRQVQNPLTRLAQTVVVRGQKDIIAQAMAKNLQHTGVLYVRGQQLANRLPEFILDQPPHKP